jgi:hypothetical protein
VVKKISADSKAVIASNTLNINDIIDVDQYSDILYLVGDQTLYKIDGRTLEPYGNSLPLLGDALGVVVDESRKTLWQINKSTLSLRSLYGDVICEIDIPEIDVNVSSSSSSSSNSDISSSSSSSRSSSSESSESVGNISSSSSSNSSSSESSLDITDPLFATGFSAFPELQGMYNAVGEIDGYYIYHNANKCILQHDPYGTTRWKLYLNETNRALARDHYYKNTETVDPFDGGLNNYNIHMWWDISGIPLSGTSGSISDTP